MKYKHYFPEEVVEHVFHYLTCNEDRNSVSLVCKSWYNIERLSRNKVMVVNVYFINPDKVMARFPNLKSLTLKGKRDSYVFTTRPPYWSASLHPWIEALVSARVELEELRLKRIVVSDKTLRLITKSFANFKSLSLVSCQGFTTDGLAAIASKCRFLRELDLQNNEIDDPRGQWLSCFPDSCTTLVSLNFAWLSGQVNLEALERLVARCRNLKSLRVNRTVRLDALQKILVQAPQLVDLGVGTFLGFVESYSKLKIALRKCSSIRSFSGFLFAAAHRFLPAIYPICQRLTSLNLSHSPIADSSYLMELIRHCLKLECLWIRDSIGDEGLRIVSSTCKELQELRIFPERYFGVTEEGLVAVSAGCPKLKSLQYMCQQMTNVALITVAKNCPNLVRFKLFLGNPKGPDAITMQPLDEGFGAIVQSCKGLKQLKLSGLLTDQVFLYIGMYAEQLQKLTIPFAGDSDKGMLYVLNGCKKLKELNIRNSFFENVELLVDVGKYEMMRSLCMFSCQVTLGACKALAQKRPRLNVEIITPDDNKDEIEKMYVYHTVVGPSKDLLDSVQTL